MVLFREYYLSRVVSTWLHFLQRKSCEESHLIIFIQRPCTRHRLYTTLCYYVVLPLNVSSLLWILCYALLYALLFLIHLIIISLVLSF